MLNLIAEAVLGGQDNDVEVALDSVTVGPAMVISVAVLAVAVFFLLFSLVRRLRRSRYRAEAQEVVRAELAEREAREASGQAEGPAPGGDES